MRPLRCAFALLLAFAPLAAMASRPVADRCTPVMSTLQLDTPAFAPERITVDIYLPGDYARSARKHYPVLYANDGQDMQAVKLVPTLVELCRKGAIREPIVTAVHMLHDRASGYGLSDRASGRSIVGGSKIGPIGARASDYSQWFATRLVPYVDAHYRTLRSTRGRSVLGWSLGALNAFNLGWEYPEVFGTVGAFSPSFWLAADRSSDEAAQRTRLAQRIVDQGSKRNGLRFWFAAGTAEERNDRDHDGVIDVIDDVEDLVNGYRGPDGFRERGLRDLGYTINMDYAEHARNKADVSVYLLPDGHHNQASWAKMLPLFLRWDYGARVNASVRASTAPRRRESSARRASDCREWWAQQGSNL